VFTYPAGCDLDPDILETVTMVIVAREGERNCKLRPLDRARCTLVHLRKNDTFEQLSAGFGISTATAHRCVTSVTDLLASLAPSLHEALTSTHTANEDLVLIDGTVAEGDRTQAAGHYSGKVHREGTNLQAISTLEGKLLWLSPALPGGTHDARATREHEITDVLHELDLQALADRGYIGVDDDVLITPIKRRAGQELAEKHMKSNKVHARLRAPIERVFSRIKQWRIFRHARVSPSRMSSIAAAVLTLMVYT
jgi:hypothetical protein